LSENCTIVLAQIGSTPILHCEVADIGEGTVSMNNQHIIYVTLHQPRYSMCICICQSSYIFADFTVFTPFENSVVGIAPGYGLDDRGVRVRVSVGSRKSRPVRP
jgi:hypothetical protein